MTDRQPRVPVSPWDEDELREMLDETEYDSELGLELARDAQRLVAGDITEEEFHDRHHEAIVDEFGADDRPLETITEAAEEATADRDPVAFLERIGNDDEYTRRDAMKVSGAAAGALAIGAWGTAEQMGDDASSLASTDTNPQDGDTQWGMVIDLDRCDGCLGCVEACREENQWERGANWMYVLAYEDDTRSTGEDFLIRPCMHCGNAPCEKVCPVEARHTRDKDGLVLTDYDICIGCRYCQVACPYGVNYFQWGEPAVDQEEIPEEHTYDERGRWVDSRPPKGTMGKCTMCPTRQDGLLGEDKVGTVACMDMCDEMGMNAIHFGDLSDPESRPNQYIRERRRQETGRRPGSDKTADDFLHTSTKEQDISTFRLLEEMGTEPNVIYIGNQPGPNAQQVDGPVTYEAVGSTDRRKDVLDEGADADQRPFPFVADGGEDG